LAEYGSSGLEHDFTRVLSSGDDGEDGSDFVNSAGRDGIGSEKELVRRRTV